MDTKIFQFGQRGAEKMELKDLNLISKSLLFVPYYCLIDFLRWVGIFDHSFLWYFLTKDRNFCNHWKENFLNFVKLTLHLSVVHSWYPIWPLKCYSLNIPILVFTEILEAKLKCLNAIISALPWPNRKNSVLIR